MSPGPAQIQALRQHTARADTEGTFLDQVDARIAQLDASFYEPHGAHQLTPFVWLLRALDTGLADPERRRRVLRFGKWAMTLMTRVPSIPRDTVLRTTADIQRRYVAEGWSLNGFLEQRTLMSLDLEPVQTTRVWLARWRESRRDLLSDCLACEAHQLATVLAALGDPRAAIQVATPVLAGRTGCSIQPASLQSWATDWFMQIGDTASARDMHLQSWEVVWRERSRGDERAPHLSFLARSGNIARAVDLLVPLVDRFDELANPGDRMDFLAAAAGLLRLGMEAGVAPSRIDGRPTAEVAERWLDEALLTARDFDRRNETHAVSRRVVAAHEMRPYAMRCDLGL